MNSIHNTHLCVKAKAYIEGKPTVFIVKGRAAQTLVALIKARTSGIITLELSSTWALRLSGYIHLLRNNNNLQIETVKEKHDGGWHGRYVLHTHVEILEISEAHEE